MRWLPLSGGALALFICGAAASAAAPAPAAPETRTLAEAFGVSAERENEARALDACRSGSATPRGALVGCFYRASFLVSRAARHLISFETGIGANPDDAVSFTVAAAVTVDVLVNMAGQPNGEATLARITRVVITNGLAPSANFSSGVLTITVDPTRGVAGRPSAGQIERAAWADAAEPGPAAVTCITTSQVIEGATPEACGATLKDALDALHAKGLAAAAPLLVVRAHGRILRGETTVTLAGGHGLATATDGDLTCRGDYDGDAPWQMTDILLRCSDGRTGVAKRTSSFLNQGEGTVRMSDGEVARFAFGCSTRVDDLRTCPVVHPGQSASAAQPPAQPRQPVCLLGLPHCP